MLIDKHTSGMHYDNNKKIENKNEPESINTSSWSCQTSRWAFGTYKSSCVEYKCFKTGIDVKKIMEYAVSDRLSTLVISGQTKEEGWAIHS